MVRLAGLLAPIVRLTAVTCDQYQAGYSRGDGHARQGQASGANSEPGQRYPAQGKSDGSAQHWIAARTPMIRPCAWTGAARCNVVSATVPNSPQ